MEEADFKIVESKRNIEASPFNFKVDERLKNRDKSTDCLKDLSKSSFKAKQMPNYKFFEPTKDCSKSPIKFRAFDLETSKRKKRTHSDILELQDQSFKA